MTPFLEAQACVLAVAGTGDGRARGRPVRAKAEINHFINDSPKARGPLLTLSAEVLRLVRRHATCHPLGVCHLHLKRVQDGVEWVERRGRCYSVSQRVCHSRVGYRSSDNRREGEETEKRGRHRGRVGRQGREREGRRLKWLVQVLCGGTSASN